MINLADIQNYFPYTPIVKKDFLSILVCFVTGGSSDVQGDIIGQASFVWRGFGCCVRIGVNGRAGSGDGGRLQGGSSDRGVCIHEQHA
jgi:hypothetical protein